MKDLLTATSGPSEELPNDFLASGPIAYISDAEVGPLRSFIRLYMTWIQTNLMHVNVFSVETLPPCPGCTGAQALTGFPAEYF